MKMNGNQDKKVDGNRNRKLRGTLWDRSPYLSLAKDVLNSDDNWLNKLESKFVRQSILLSQVNWFIAILIMLGLGAGLVFSLIKQREALIGQVESSRQGADAALASSQDLTAMVEILRANQTLQEPLLKVFKPDIMLRKQVEGTLHRVVYGVRERNSLEPDFAHPDRVVGHKGIVVGLGVSSEKIAGIDETGRICLWDRSGKLLDSECFQGPQGFVTSASFNPDVSLLATITQSQDSDGNITSDRSTLELWDLENRQVKEFNIAEDEPWRVGFSQDGQYVATQKDEDPVRWWNLSGDETENGSGEEPAFNRPMTVHSSDGKIATIQANSNTLDNGTFVVTDQFGVPVTVRTNHDYIEKWGFSPDGQQLMTAGKDGIIRVWDFAAHSFSGEQPDDLSVNNPTESCASDTSNPLCLSPDGGITATRLPEDNRVVQLDRFNKSFKLEGHSRPIDTVIFRPDTKGNVFNLLMAPLKGALCTLPESKEIINICKTSPLLATGSTDGTVRLWNFDGQEIAKLTGAAGQAIMFSFNGDGSLLASAGLGDGKAKVLDVKSRVQVAEFNTGTTGNALPNLRFSDDGEHLIINNLPWPIESVAQLLERGCFWVKDYIDNNPNVSSSDKRLCDGIDISQLPQTLPEQTLRISAGERILVPSLADIEKQAGVEAIRKGDFATAIQYLEAYLKRTPNDPEALIYLNNARIGVRDAYTLAVSAPISSDVNGALELLRGVAQAQDEVNQAGGINQVPLRVLIADDANNPDTAQQIAEALVSNPDVMGVVGHYASDVTLATGKIYEAGKLVAISPVSTSVKLTGFSDSIFRTVPSDSVAAEALADYMRSQLGKRKAAVFYNSESNYSESLKSEFVKFLSEAGGQASSTSVFDLSDPSFDVEQSVEQSIESGAEVLVLLPNTGELNDTLQVVRANSRRLPLLSGDDVYTPKTLETGTANAEGMVVAVPWHILASQPQFRTTSRQLWRADVNWRTAMSYDAALALMTGLRQNPTREGLAEILRSQDFAANGATGSIKFDQLGDRDRDIQLVEIEETGIDSRSGYGYDFVPIP